MKNHLFFEHIAVPLLALPLLAACMPLFTADVPEMLPSRGQTLAQLHLQQAQTPLAAVWIPYFTVERLLAAPDAAAAESGVSAYLSQLHSKGVRSVFVHMCAFGESLYPSAYYPPSALAGGFDGMQIFTEACAENDMALHAWLNPLRLQTAEHMEAQRGDSRLHAIYADADSRAEMMFCCDGRYYLNPCVPETADFLAGAVAELAENYHPAGIHIDDYFYPSPAPDADAAQFAASGAADLGAWRRENISAMVRRMYDAAHLHGDTLFSVSPQGNLLLNRDALYADAERWLAEAGYCDLMLPQLYFGYENETCPFAETLAQWTALPRSDAVALAVGLAAYKSGEPDEYAGSGLLEWQQDDTVLARQAAEVYAMPELAGVSFYHSDAFLEQDLQIGE